MFAAYFSGLVTGLGLIVAIGAQNAFVLRQGLRGEHVFVLVMICAISDALLVSAGVAGFGVVIDRLPWLEPVLLYGGVAFLVVYGFTSLRAAWTTEAGLAPSDMPSLPLKKAVAICLAFTWLNPHVYLDTVVFLGALSTRFPGREVFFGLGAVTASFAFFFSLGYGARLLRPLLSKPGAWRVLDAFIGLIMWAIAARLLTA
ncbi:LysE/ArgO family amino acid transporter [Rhizobium sp. L1K21]|uniref:LysE/ArgO family amino acid transporter n=1 Tax=Rhizobium sp. L1K21 TaxID=2954933 RepID=UPI00209332BE|nr:LysE/ArgO family amino acid transporter [Rhizobium sp. L1K21]MCO6186828.1 LysE/ArgO family amino acid transporter [Rhizobium sp. L1K21]